MEGIFKILASEGIEIDEDTRKKLNKKIASEYKSIAEFSELKRKMEEANTKLNDYSEISKSVETLKNENAELNKLYEASKTSEWKLEALKNGVNVNFVDFVTYEVMKNMSEDTKFTDALEAYTKSNPQYTTLQQPGIKVSTTPIVSNPTEKNLRPGEYINDFIRGKI